MLAIVPLRSFRELALTMCVGVLLETSCALGVRQSGFVAPSRTEIGKEL